MDAASIERDLAVYYNREGSDRAGRDLDPQRVAARARFLSMHTSPGAASLEIGTGPGRDLAAFRDAGVVAHGVDLSPVFAALAAASGAHLATATARRLPFRDESFDVVWSMSTLMHIPDNAIAGALGELRRVLRRDGVACLGVWGGADVSSLLPGAFGDRLFARRSPTTWRHLLETIGTIEEFEVWEREGEDYSYHWAVIRRTL